MNADPREPARLGSVGFTAILWLVAAFFVMGAFGFGYPANVAPLLLGGTAFALLSALLFTELRRVWRWRQQTTETTETPAPTPETAASATPSGAGESAAAIERLALAWMVGSVVLLVLLGFLVGVTLAMLGLLRVYGREPWIPTIVTTVGVIASLYVAFGVVLGVPFYPGVLGLWP